MTLDQYLNKAFRYRKENPYKSVQDYLKDNNIANVDEYSRSKAITEIAKRFNVEENSVRLLIEID